MTIFGDSASRERRDHQPFAMPSIKSATARRVKVPLPRRFFTGGREYMVDEVIEIDVETNGDFPIGGTGPALFVGNLPVVDSDRLGECRYRFFAPGSAKIEADAPLALGRAGSGVPRPEKRFKVRLNWLES